MTPKEKAEELFHQYRVLACDDTIEKRERTAKNCTLILVDEMIKEFDQYSDVYSILNPCETDDAVSIIEKVEYWKQIKEEIEKL